MSRSPPRADSATAGQHRPGGGFSPSPSGRMLNEVYHRLLAVYGPQHWWPAESPFEVMVGAILTQSASWANAARAIANLKAARALSPQALRHLSPQELAQMIRPSGYYISKTRKLRALVLWLGEARDNLNTLFAAETGQLRDKLLSLYGIGEETADAMLLYAAGKPVFVIDAYTRRITDRLGLKPEGSKYADYQALFMANLNSDVALFNEFHALLVEHGKRICQKDPICRLCSLLDVCEYA